MAIQHSPMMTNFSGTPRSGGVQPLLRHRLFTEYGHAHNALLDSGLYGRRWMAETFRPSSVGSTLLSRLAYGTASSANSW